MEEEEDRRWVEEEEGLSRRQADLACHLTGHLLQGHNNTKGFLPPADPTEVVAWTDHPRTHPCSSSSHLSREEDPTEVVPDSIRAACSSRCRPTADQTGVHRTDEETQGKSSTALAVVGMPEGEEIREAGIPEVAVAAATILTAVEIPERTRGEIRVAGPDVTIRLTENLQAEEPVAAVLQWAVAISPRIWRVPIQTRRS